MRKYQCLILIYFFYFGINNIYAQHTDKIFFDENNTLKIVQLTDIHWSNTSDNCEKTISTIESVIKAEKPNIIILTGDVVVDPPIAMGWDAISKIFEKAQIPWIAVLGNHDTEESRGYTRNDIYNIVEKYPYYIKRPSNLKYGNGNYAIPIYNKKLKGPQSMLYCIDSNDYTDNDNWGEYDWIHFDQIKWYRDISDSVKLLQNKTLPSLAFFHIPLLEYNNIVGDPLTFGTKGEAISSSKVNSGIFASFLEKKDVLGIFVGHDHDNDFVGIEKEIALGFGRVTGTDAYGSLERGARVILLYEGQNKFDTWIRTPYGIENEYFYPSGISSTDEKELVRLPSQELLNPKNGIAYNYYQGKFKSVDDIINQTPLKKGTMANISIDSADVEDYFAFDFKGFIKIPEDGVYLFYTNSDDGSKLFIDGQLVIDNDGSHNARKIYNKVNLQKGYHPIEVRYFESYMGQELEVGWASKNIIEQAIPDEVLFIKNEYDEKK